MIRLALLLALLYPSLLSAAIHVGPERPVALPGFGTASGAQLDVSMATSGEETLVAWIDNTRGRTGAYIAVLTPDGELMEGSQRWLAPDALDVTISWTGSEYFALWTTPLGLAGSTLDRDGDRSTLVQPRLILNNVSAVSNVAWAGSTGMVVYTRNDRLQAAIIDREGSVEREGIAISNGLVHDARVATDGISFYVFWRHRDAFHHTIDAVYAARYGSDGAREDAPPVTLWASVPLRDPWDVAFDGQRFAVVLSAHSSENGTNLRRIILDAATMQATLLEPINLAATGAAGVEWNGAHFVAFWMDLANPRSHVLRSLAFSADGTEGGPVTVLEALDPTLDADGVWNGRVLVVAWTMRNQLGTETHVYATTASDGGHRERINVAMSHRWQSLPAIAANGNESLVAWIDGSAGNNEPRRLVAGHATGGFVDQEPRHYSNTALYEQPVVVFTGTMYLLVFSEMIPGTNTPRIALWRIDPRGVPLDDAPVHIAHGLRFGAAWNGRHLLVAYGAAQGDIDAVRINGTGRIADTIPSKIVTNRLANALTVASNGTDFLLVWHEGVDFGNTTPGRIDVYAIPISAAGDAIGATIDVATGPSNQRLPAVASDGRDYVIVYLHDQVLSAKKVLREGVLANTTATAAGTFIAQSPFSYTRPAIAATPEGFTVAWEVAVSLHGGDLWLARLDRDAAAVTAARVAARSGLFEMHPALATLSDGALDLAYSRLVDDPTYGATMRVFIRRVEEGPGNSGPRRRAARH